MSKFKVGDIVTGVFEDHWVYGSNWKIKSIQEGYDDFFVLTPDLYEVVGIDENNRELGLGVGAIWTENELELVEEEQKQEKQMFWIIVVASVFLLTGGGVVIAVFCGDEFSEMFSNVFASFARLDLFAFPYGFFLFAVFILLALDYWMRRAYYKRHGKG